MDTEYCKFRRWQDKCHKYARKCEYWCGFAWAWFMHSMISLCDEPERSVISLGVILGVGAWGFWRLYQYGRAVNGGESL